MTSARAAAAAGLAAALIAFAVLETRASERMYSLDAAAAERAALRDDEVRSHLREHPATRTRVTPLDDDLQRVSFFDGKRLVLDAAVDERGRVPHITSRTPGTAPNGSPIAHHPLVWALLAALMIAALAVRPWRSLRTLDTIALAGLLAPVWLFNEALVSATVWTGMGLVGYLGARALTVGLRGGGDPPAMPPLAPDRLRLLRAVTLATAAIVAMVGATSAGFTDVAFASMAGATLVLDGIAPYGNMPAEVLHGDTYPFLNYLVHVPLALVLPVRDFFSDMTGGMLAATAAGLLAGAGSFAVARRLWGAAAAWRHALAALAFPIVCITASAGRNDLLPAAALAWGLALLPHAGRAAAVIAAGAWIKLVPLLVLPLWLARERGAALARAAGGAAAVSAGTAAVLVAVGGPGALGDMADAVAFQSERGSLYSIWAQLEAPGAQRVAQALVGGLVVAAAVLVATSSALRRDTVRLAGLAAAVLAGVQIAASSWAYDYTVWLVPPLLVALFGVRSAGPAR